MKFDTKCHCGWLLPHSVMPMKNTLRAGLTEDDIIPNAIVTLVCPVCAHGHSFMSVHEAAHAPVEIQRKLGIKR